MHNIKDETIVVRDVDLPILILPNQLRVIFEQLAHKPRQFDAKGSVIVSLNVHSLGDVRFGANVYMYFGIGPPIPERLENG
jgi:hypothetical protein